MTDEEIKLEDIFEAEQRGFFKGRARGLSEAYGVAWQAGATDDVLDALEDFYRKISEGEDVIPRPSFTELRKMSKSKKRKLLE